MSTESKRFRFINTLNEISQKPGLDDYVRYREMGQKCILSDYFLGQGKYLTYERNNATGEISKFFKDKPKFSDKNNGFVAVNVEVPSSASGRAPIIPFFSISVNGICDQDTLRERVLEISKESINDSFLTCPSFVNKYQIERILFKITIEATQIKSIFIPPLLSSFKGNNDELVGRIDEMTGLLLNNLHNSFLQSWCEPFKETNQTLWCNVRAVDWDAEGQKSHSIFVCIFNTEEEIIEWVTSYGDDAMNIIAMVKSIFIADVQRSQQYEAIKSAKSAIMSRNMSHNLGSHVMAYLKQKLGSVTSILNKESNVLADLLPNYVDLDKVNNVELPFLVGLGRFIGYLQERQDYIATISTDYIPYGAPVNLKDAIYDELNPDLRYLRHKVVPNSSEGTSDANNRPANILLNYIAKSEGLSRENMGDNFTSLKDIRFGFIHFDNNEDEGSTFGFKSFYSTDNVLSCIRKISFSLPGGLVGRQAIFSIFENLIRNAAKHGNTSVVENLDFTIDVIDGSEVSTDKCIAWEKRVGDIKWRELYKNATDIKDLYILSITDNLPSSSDTITHLTGGLYEPFVDPETGRMTTANKGIKEIRISAAWLRGETNEEYYLRYDGRGSGTLAPLVAVELSPEGHLRYLFCVRKNKTVAIIPEVLINSGNAKRVIRIDDESMLKFRALEEVDKDRWTIMSEEQLLTSKTSYSLILIPDSPEVFYKLRPFTSNRVIRWKSTEGYLSKLNDSNSALLLLYQLFTGENEQSEDVFIDDGRALGENNRREEATGEHHFHKIRFDAENIDFSSKRPVFLYTTHLSNEKDYKKFALTQHYHDYECAEGITGDNSSDRLIRREKLDELWYYTHLYAFKKKVAIIDERLFKMAHSIDERQFVAYGDLDFKALQDAITKGLLSEDYIIQVIQSNYAAFNLSDENQAILFSASSLNELEGIIDCVPAHLIEDIDNLPKKNQQVVGNCHLTPYYHGKSIDIFTVVLGADGKMMLVGCVDSLFEGESFKNRFEALATFERDDYGHIVLVPSKIHGELIYKKFDYISIHQGILDKIYENLGIKNDGNSKIELTSYIYSCLMKDSSTIGDYLPRFIIHSGRAKPTKEDMPQKQPFIQYAAIENAVKDCKPMLIELLDYAKFELT